MEDAQARLTRAQVEKDGLYDEIRKKHGALADLDRDCRYERHSGQPGGPARKLRQAYNVAAKELRLAKSDLARMRNEERQAKPEITSMSTKKSRKKEEKEDKIVIPPNASPELVEQQQETVADVASESKAVQEENEGCWDTFHDRAAEAPDPMLEEGQGEPIIIEVDELEEEKESGQMTLEGGFVPKATIWIKPQAIPYEIRTEKFKLNTTEEGFQNRHDAEDGDLTQWVAKKLKVLKDTTIMPGDFDRHVQIMVDVIKGRIEAPMRHVGEDEED